MKLGGGFGFSIGPAGRIYTPSLALDTHLSFRYGIDLAAIYDALSHGSKWAIKAFMASESEELTNLEKRIFKALDWYNQSCEYGIHPYKSLVFLAIAFEALLNLEWEQKNTARFKDVVMSLLDSVDRLDTWLNQFFDARGSIVHTGEAASLSYSPPQVGGKPEPQKKAQGGKTPEPKSDIPTGLLTHQGRLIFHLCLDAILSSSVTAHEANLRASFIHGEERINEIIRLLDDDKTELRQRIIPTRNLVFELCGSIYRPASKVKPASLIKVTNKMISIYLGSKLHETLGIPTEITSKMADLVKSVKEVNSNKAKIDRALHRVTFQCQFSTSHLACEFVGVGWTPWR